MIIVLAIFAYIFIGFIVIVLCWWFDSDDKDWTVEMFLCLVLLWPLVLIVTMIELGIEKAKAWKKDYYGDD